MLNIRNTGTDKRKKIDLKRLRFDMGALIPGDPGFAGPGAGAAGIGAGGGVLSIRPVFPGTGGAYGPPGSGLQSAQEAAASTIYSAAEGAAGRAAYAASGPQEAPFEAPAPIGPAAVHLPVPSPSSVSELFPTQTPPASTTSQPTPKTVVNESGRPLPVVGAANLLRPGYRIHHLGTQGSLSSGETVAGVLASTGASQAALSLSGKLSQIGRLSVGFIGYEASKAALEKIARGEMPTLPELTGLATFAASLYLLAPEEGLGFVATGLAWLSTIGRGLIKAGEVAAATEAVDIGERLVTDVGQQSGRLLQQQSQQPAASPAPAPVAAVPAAQTLRQELQPPGPSVPLPQPQPSAEPSQPLTVPQSQLGATPELVIRQQQQEIQRLMEEQHATQPQNLPLETGQPHLQPLEALSGQPGGVPPPAPGPRPLPFEHQPGGCYSPQQMEELVSCPNFQKALTDHFHIVHQPGQRPVLTPKQSVCICCDSTQDMRDYVESGGVRGACMQVEGLQNIHPKLGGG